MAVAEKSGKIGWGKALSSIRKGVKTYGSPIVAVAVLVIVAGNLAATARVRFSLDQLLAVGIVASKPQEAITEWTDERGLVHRITSARGPSDTDAILRARHDELVAAFLLSFPPK